MPQDNLSFQDTADFDVHVKLKMRGNSQNLAAFHKVMACIDTDWPWSPDSNSTECPICGGMTYPQPRINAQDIAAAAKQTSASVKIKQYSYAHHCEARALLLSVLDSNTTKEVTSS